MSINLAPIKNKDGIPEYWVAVQDDITEQRKNELKIAEQTELIRTIIDATPNLVFLKDKEGKFTVVNNAVANLFDTSIDGLMERVNSNPEDYKLDSIDKMVLDTGKTINLEENLILSNGEQRMYHTTKRLLIQPDGNRAILGVSVDVTEMKQQEQELAQEKSKLAFILSSIPAMVTIFDVEAQNYEYSNEEFRAHNKKNILGKNNSYFNVDTSEKIKQMHDDVKEKGTLTKKEIRDLGNGPEKYLCKHQYLNGDNQIIISIYTELPE